MTLKYAILVLIKATSRELRGGGLGLRPQISDGQREKEKEAIEKCWLYLYGREMDDNDRYNIF